MSLTPSSSSLTPLKICSGFPCQEMWSHSQGERVRPGPGEMAGRGEAVGVFPVRQTVTGQ